MVWPADAEVLARRAGQDKKRDSLSHRRRIAGDKLPSRRAAMNKRISRRAGGLDFYVDSLAGEAI